MKNKILNLAKSSAWFVLCLLVGALIFEGIRSFANINKPAKRVGISVITEEEHYVNAASLWHDLKEEKPTLRKLVMFRYNGGGVKPTSLHHGAMSDDGWIVTRGNGTHRIESLYEFYDKIEWLDFDELK